MYSDLIEWGAPEKRKVMTNTEKELSLPPEEQIDCQDIEEEPQVIEEIIVEELSIDGICGVY
jgi:mycofactocin precursor